MDSHSIREAEDTVRAKNGRRWTWIVGPLVTLLVFGVGALVGSASERGQYKEKVDNHEVRISDVERMQKLDHDFLMELRGDVKAIRLLLETQGEAPAKAKGRLR